MTARTKWNGLQPHTRRLIVAAGAVDALLKIAALIDLARRPGNEIRGSKTRWAAALTLTNSLGTVPLAYFAWGRRTSSS